jgi:hypothetical protein
LQNDKENAEAYVGLDEAMSLTGAYTTERSALLSRYSSADDPMSKMPTNLVYQLALTRAEAGQFEQALALFKKTLFPGEKKAITSAQVLSEIQLMHAEDRAATSNCSAAECFLRGEQTGGKPAREYLKVGGNCTKLRQCTRVPTILAAGRGWCRSRGASMGHSGGEIHGKKRFGEGTIRYRQVVGCS